MSRHGLLVAASAIALAASFATAGLSQAPPGNVDTKRSERKADDQPDGKSGAAQRQPESSPKASERAKEKAAPESRVQGKDATPKASDRAEEKASPKSAVQSESKGDDGDRRSRVGDDATKQRSKQQSQQTPAKDADRTAGDDQKDEKPERRGDRADGDRQNRTGAAGDRAKERVQLSEQKRTSIRERLAKTGSANRVTKVNFDIRVGVKVPRRGVNLRVLPPSVVEIIPEYRGYRYVFVRDEIVIIHPTEYVIVAVIGDDGRVAGRTVERITLAPDARIFVRRNVDFGARIQLGIGDITIGMDLPTTYELRPLPNVVVQRYSKLRGYRYFIFDDDVVLVEPDSRKVALVIEK